MGKKRKTSSHAAITEPSNGFEAKGGKMRPITTYEDVANSEDEFHLNREKVMLKDGPDAKRRKKWEQEDSFLEPSDDEVLGYSSGGEGEDSHDDAIPANNRKNVDSSGEEEEGEEDEDDVGAWGSSKKDYYNNDQIETEADALEEEAEAKRLQQKKLQKMSAADFGLDDIEWFSSENKNEEEEDEADVITEVLKDVEISSDMGPEERLRILYTRFPEFEHLANEFLELQPLLEPLRQQMELECTSLPVLKRRSSPTIIKARALASYLATISMYFALLTSPAAKGESRTMNPNELHDHEIMEYLVKCRRTWLTAKNLNIPTVSEQNFDEEESLDDPTISGKINLSQDVSARSPRLNKKARAQLAATEEAASLRAKRLEQLEEDLADLSTLAPKSRKTAKKAKETVVADDDSDFGEEETMDAKAAAEKEKKKKSLRFYTSQIVQKVNKRAGAGRDAGGDDDLPHRERLRDRQARLNLEAEKRGKKLDEYGRGGVALGDESDSGDEDIAEQVRDEGDEYYDLVAKASQKKKEDKKERLETIKKAEAEGAMVRVVEGEVDEDGKRAIGYVIQKNKGLAPKRKKDVRNPRVKKRKKYEEKKKKLASMKAVYKGGEERGGYAGEKTGIKTGLIKSIKL